MGIMPLGCVIPEELKEQAKALYVQGVTTSDIAEEIGVPYGAIRTWIKRGKWGSLRTITQQKAGPAKERAAIRALTFIQPGARMPAASASKLREGLSAEVASQMAVLQSEPVKRASELANTREREGRASVVKRLVDSAAILEDWESQRTPGIVVMTESSAPADEAPREIAAIDVQSEPVPDAAQEAIRALQEE